MCLSPRALKLAGKAHKVYEFLKSLRSCQFQILSQQCAIDISRAVFNVRRIIFIATELNTELISLQIAVAESLCALTSHFFLFNF